MQSALRDAVKAKSQVPVWRQGLAWSVLSVDYQRILTVLADRAWLRQGPLVCQKMAGDGEEGADEERVLEPVGERRAEPRDLRGSRTVRSPAEAIATHDPRGLFTTHALHKHRRRALSTPGMNAMLTQAKSALGVSELSPWPAPTS
ncbi:hypothetical protein [Streptomyces tauricus]|uniref:hypothetical protein n=1 Tax=Streptomyces tauricus TaxID=68274 RepID=UPI00224399C8|nr:hypothetical protein [Streptomyces tauricus]MCW8101751.1 hypothetical protein [Streptomyces tauricus]